MSVISIQKKLGFNQDKQDGSFGPMTSKAIMSFYNLTPIQCAHFLGQCDHETGSWKIFKENLNYSPQGLANTWPKRYAVNPSQKPRKPNGLALSIGNNKEAIANITYSNRMGNGNPESGDGWRFIGRGAIQLTGRSNYTEFSKYVNDPEILLNPDKIIDEYILESAKWFFDKNKLWVLCTDFTNDTITKITKRINGGTNGLQDRITKTNKYKNWLNA